MAKFNIPREKYFISWNFKAGKKSANLFIPL